MAVKIQTVSISRCSFKWRNLLLGNQTLAYMYIATSLEGNPLFISPHTTHFNNKSFQKHILSCTTSFSWKNTFYQSKSDLQMSAAFRIKRSPIFIHVPSSKQYMPTLWLPLNQRWGTLHWTYTTQHLTPFCDSAPSRESVKRTSITALLGTNKQHELVIKI